MLFDIITDTGKHMGNQEKIDVENIFLDVSECKNGRYLANTSNHCQQLTKEKL